MDYSSLVLLGLALAGVLLHNLVKINEINKDPNKANFTVSKYWAKEWAAILISVIVSAIAAFLQSEIRQLQAAGNWLGVGFVAIGYMSQSILVSVMGRAQKIIGGEEKTGVNNTYAEGPGGSTNPNPGGLPPKP